MVLGDFNGDGKVDFAILNYQGTGVTILLGNGDGTFYQSANYAVTPSPVMMAAEDLNADGKLDLALVTGDSMVSILLGNGDGTFQPATKYPAGTESISITVEDMSGDGRPDLIVGDGLSTAIGVLIGNGDGSFQAPALFYNAFLSPAFIAAGDFTGAGMVGVAVASQGGEFGTIFDGEAAAPAALRAVSVSPASGSGTGQSFAFQFSDSGGITDVYTMSVMFSANPNSLANACVLTLTRSTNMRFQAVRWKTSPFSAGCCRHRKGQQ